MTSRKVLLPDAFWFQEGPGVRKWQFTNSGIKLLNVGNITKEGVIDLSKTDRYLSEEEANGKYEHFLCDEGDLVIASSGISFDDDGMLRTRGAFITKEHLPLCMNTSTIRFKAKKNISDLNFLKFWLDSYEFRDQISRQVTGSAQQNFGPMQLRETWITLPTLPEQRRIADLLSRADRLRQLHRVCDSLRDSLLQSVFLEMFGNPKTNPKGWDVFELGYVVEINPSGRPKANAEQPTSFLPMNLVEPSNVFSNTLDINQFDEVSTGYTYFEENDVLFAKITPCMENGNIVIAKNLLNGFGFGSTEFHVIRQNDKANAFWLYGLVKRPEFREEATRWFRGTAGQQRVPSDFLNSYLVPIPPLPEQEQFAAVVRRVEALRGRAGESARQGEGLFQSLLSQAFG